MFFFLIDLLLWLINIQHLRQLQSHPLPLQPHPSQVHVWLYFAIANVEIALFGFMVTEVVVAFIPMVNAKLAFLSHTDCCYGPRMVVHVLVSLCSMSLNFKFQSQTHLHQLQSLLPLLFPPVCFNFVSLSHCYLLWASEVVVLRQENAKLKMGLDLVDL